MSLVDRQRPERGQWGRLSSVSGKELIRTPRPRGGTLSLVLSPARLLAAGGPGHGALRTGIRSRDIQLAPTCPPAPRPHPHLLGAEALPYPSQRPLASELHPALASDWLLSEPGQNHVGLTKSSVYTGQAQRPKMSSKEQHPARGSQHLCGTGEGRPLWA